MNSCSWMQIRMVLKPEGPSEQMRTHCNQTTHSALTLPTDIVFQDSLGKWTLGMHVPRYVSVFNATFEMFSAPCAENNEVLSTNSKVN